MGVELMAAGPSPGRRWYLRCPPVALVVTRNARARRWTTVHMSKSVPNGDVLSADVVVVGGGPAGEVLAGRVADRGLETVLVERELVGGECSYWGCIPSKTLVRPGDVLAAARRVPGAAGAVTGRIDLPAALARRDYMTSSWMDSAQERWLADRGVRLVRGVGRLAGERQVAGDGGPTIRARRAGVLAPGRGAVMPAVAGPRGG